MKTPSVRSLATAAVLAVALTLGTACSLKSVANGTVIALEAVVDASTGLIGTAAAIQNPTTGVLTALGYAKAANVAAVASITEYNSTDSAAVKIGLITGYWSKLVVPVVGQADASLIAGGVSLVASAIEQLIKQIHPASAALSAHTVGAKVAIAALAPLVSQSAADKGKLKTILQKANTNVDAADKLLAR